MGASGRGLTQPPGGQRSFLEKTFEQSLEGQVWVCKWRAEAGGFHAQRTACKKGGDGRVLNSWVFGDTRAE